MPGMRFAVYKIEKGTANDFGEKPKQPNSEEIQ
jgi:hypothetical protein